MAKSHSFNTDHAAKYGLEEAVMIHSFQWWLERNRGDGANQYEGRTWGRNTYNQLAEFFPYWDRRKVIRVVEALVEKGVLIKRSGISDASFYAFADESQFLGVRKEEGVPKTVPRTENGTPRVPKIVEMGTENGTHTCIPVPKNSSSSCARAGRTQSEEDDDASRGGPTQRELFGPKAGRICEIDGLPHLTDEQHAAAMAATVQAFPARDYPTPDEMTMWRRVFNEGLKADAVPKIVAEVLARNKAHNGKPVRSMLYFRDSMVEAAREASKPAGLEPKYKTKFNPGSVGRVYDLDLPETRALIQQLRKDGHDDESLRFQGLLK